MHLIQHTLRKERRLWPVAAFTLGNAVTAAGAIADDR